MSKTDKLKPLPFSFAKRHGVVFFHDTNGIELLYLEGFSVSVLAEVRRVIRSKFACRQVDQAVFDKALSDAYHKVREKDLGPIASTIIELNKDGNHNTRLNREENFQITHEIKLEEGDKYENTISVEEFKERLRKINWLR